MTEGLKPVRTEGFARECREIADGLKVEYGQRKNRNGLPYFDFERHPYAGRAGALLRQATAIVAELEAMRATLAAPSQPEGATGTTPDDRAPVPKAGEAVAVQPSCYWIEKAEQFAMPPKDGSKLFARAWKPLYDTKAMTEIESAAFLRGRTAGLNFAKLSAGAAASDEGEAVEHTEDADPSEIAEAFRRIFPGVRRAPAPPRVLKVIPGDEMHLTILGVPYGFNFLMGKDRQDMLAYGRAVWAAALSAPKGEEPQS